MPLVAWRYNLHNSYMEDVGLRIRSMRQEQGLTLKDIAEQVNLSVGFLSQLERGKTSGSLLSLRRICAAIGCSLSELLDEPLPDLHTSEPQYATTTPPEQVLIHLPKPNLTHRVLTSNLHSRTLEALITEYPAAYHQRKNYHEREEFGYVLEGVLILEVKDDEILLHSGDCFQILPFVPHAYRTTKDEGARVLMASTGNLLRIYGSDIAQLSDGSRENE